jgi:hypothetical protein
MVPWIPKLGSLKLSILILSGISYPYKKVTSTAGNLPL